MLMLSSCAQLCNSPIVTAPPEHNQAVVFDIDGTLTPHTYNPWWAREDAAKVAHIFANKGYKIFYLSARIDSLTADIPSWLKDNGFPDGSIYVPQTNEDHSCKADCFKTRILNELKSHGWNIMFAYGNSSTDFKAYAAAEIPIDHVFGLLNIEDTLCEKGDWIKCLKGWTEHVEYVENKVPTLLKR